MGGPSHGAPGAAMDRLQRNFPMTVKTAISPPQRAGMLFLAAFLFCTSAYAGTRGAVMDEKPGAAVPLDTPFHDETGSTVLLGDAVTGPTVVTLNYLSCTNVCTDILDSLSGVLEELSYVPGKDFQIVTVSFDESDSPEKAMRKKREYMKATGMGGPGGLPAGAWRFLTGDRESIERLAGAVGFGFERTEGGFDHPAVTVVLSGEGRIVRYIYGSSYVPSDLDMAIREASEGRVGAVRSRLFSFCYSYDPGEGRYALNYLRVVGVFMLASVAGAFIYLARSGRRIER